MGNKLDFDLGCKHLIGKNIHHVEYVEKVGRYLRLAEAQSDPIRKGCYERTARGAAFWAVYDGGKASASRASDKLEITRQKHLRENLSPETIRRMELSHGFCICR